MQGPAWGRLSDYPFPRHILPLDFLKARLFEIAVPLDPFLGQVVGLFLKSRRPQLQVVGNRNVKEVEDADDRFLVRSYEVLVDDNARDDRTVREVLLP